MVSYKHPSNKLVASVTSPLYVAIIVRKYDTCCIDPGHVSRICKWRPCKIFLTQSVFDSFHSYFYKDHFDNNLLSFYKTHFLFKENLLFNQMRSE